MNSSSSDNLLRENEQDVQESTSQPTLDPVVPSKSSYEENPAAVPSVTKAVSEEQIGHIPHKSFAFDDEVHDHRIPFNMADDGMLFTHPADSLDSGRGYGNRRVLSPLPPADSYFDPIRSHYGHRQTLSLHNIGSDTGFQRPETSSSAKGPLGLSTSYQPSELLSEPPLFQEHEMIGSYTRTPPPFPYNCDYPPSYRLPPHPSTSYSDRLSVSSSSRPVGQPPSHRVPYSGMLFNPCEDVMPLNGMDTGSSSQPCSPVPVETIEEMLSRSPIPPGLDVPPRKMPYACRDYRNGKCTRGDKCKFLHVIEDLGSNETQRVRNSQICRDFLRGQCRRRNCKFLHAVNDGDGFYPYNPHTYHHEPMNEGYSHSGYRYGPDGGYGRSYNDFGYGMGSTGQGYNPMFNTDNRPYNNNKPNQEYPSLK